MYGLDDKVINLLRSYLSNRDQFVQLGNIKSNHQLISHGIPQGSVIGPLLCNIVINDLTSATAKISKVVTWLQSNKLKLNVSKSKFMLFYKHPKVVPKLNY